MFHVAVALSCMTCSLGLLVKAEGGALPGPIPTHMKAESTPMVVTSDTLDYCKTLAHKVRKSLRQNALAPSVDQATFLEHEGEALCAHGHLRSGITQERRALVVLMRS